MRKLGSLAGAIALVLVASPAGAADLYKGSGSAPTADTFGDNTFAGFYVDAAVGGAVTTTTFDKSVAGSLKPSNYSFSGFSGDADIGYRFANGYWRYIVWGNVGGQSVTLDNSGVNQNLRYGGGVGIGYVLHGVLWSLNTGYIAQTIQGSGVNETINNWSIEPRIDVPLSANLGAFVATEIDYAPSQTIKNVKLEQVEVYPKVGLSLSLGGSASPLK